MGELVINDEREEKSIAKYLKVKRQVLDAYKESLGADQKARLADEQNEYEYFMSKTERYIEVYEMAYLLNILTEKLSEIGEHKENHKDVHEKITQWRGYSRQLLAKIST